MTMNTSNRSLVIYTLLLQLLTAARCITAFSPSPALTTTPRPHTHSSIRVSSSSSSSQQQNEQPIAANWDKVTDEWELDCYSRPVLVDGKKKLWEILMTDSSGSLRVCRVLPSNK